MDYTIKPTFTVNGETFATEKEADDYSDRLVRCDLITAHLRRSIRSSKAAIGHADYRLEEIAQLIVGDSDTWREAVLLAEEGPEPPGDIEGCTLGDRIQAFRINRKNGFSLEEAYEHSSE